MMMAGPLHPPFSLFLPEGKEKTGRARSKREKEVWALRASFFFSYGSSRQRGMLMQRGPPRPLESSALGMVWTLMPASSKERLVT